MIIGRNGGGRAFDLLPHVFLSSLFLHVAFIGLIKNILIAILRRLSNQILNLYLRYLLINDLQRHVQLVCLEYHGVNLVFFDLFDVI